MVKEDRLVYTFLELAEHPIVNNQISEDMLLEIVLFALPLGIAISLSEILLGVVAEKDRAVNLLDEKNRLTFKYLIFRGFAEVLANRLKKTTDELLEAHKIIQSLK